MSNTPADTIIITAVDPAGPSVTCAHGDGTSNFTSQSGWQFTARPRRSSFSEFMGYDPYTLTVPVIFGNGFDTTVNIEADLEVLRGIARDQVGPRNEPAVVKIDCPAIPLNWLKWTINDIKFNTQYRNNDGTRYYAQVDITFFEYVPTDLVATQAPTSVAQKVVATAKAKAASSQITTAAVSTSPIGTNRVIIGVSSPAVIAAAGPWQSGNTYTVKKGDTLETIAAKMMGSAALWQQIAALNGNIRDPKSITVGQVLLIPAYNVANI